MSVISYTVKKGDTLSSIASKHKTTVTAIKNANPDLIKNVNIIRVGWVLKIPTSTYSTGSSNSSADVSALLKKCVSDIQNLDSFKALSKLI